MFHSRGHYVPLQMDGGWLGGWVNWGIVISSLNQVEVEGEDELGNNHFSNIWHINHFNYLLSFSNFFSFPYNRNLVIWATSVFYAISALSAIINDISNIVTLRILEIITLTLIISGLLAIRAIIIVIKGMTALMPYHPLLPFEPLWPLQELQPFLNR